MSKENEGSLHMTEPRKPREVFVKNSSLDVISEHGGEIAVLILSEPRDGYVKVREVMEGDVITQATRRANKHLLEKLDRTRLALEKAKGWVVAQSPVHDIKRALEEIERIENGNYE